jgi:hypothetical protein
MQILLDLCIAIIVAAFIAGTFRFWMRRTDGAVGPAIVATVLSAVVTGLCYFAALKGEEAKENERGQGFLPAKRSVISSPKEEIET